MSVAVRDQRPAWLNARTLFGTTLFLLSLVSGWHLLEGADRGIRIWAAGRDLPAGVPLRASDLVPVIGDLGPEQAPMYLSAEVDLTGAELTRPVTGGELVAAAFVARAEQGFEGHAITIPVTPEHAVGGDLAPGDLVDVYATLDPGRDSPQTVLVVEAAQIIDLLSSSDLMVESSALTGLTLGVGATDAARLAHAIRTADIDVVKVHGEGSASIPGSVTRDDL